MAIDMIPIQRYVTGTIWGPGYMHVGGAKFHTTLNCTRVRTEYRVVEVTIRVDAEDWNQLLVLGDGEIYARRTAPCSACVVSEDEWLELVSEHELAQPR